MRVTELFRLDWNVSGTVIALVVFIVLGPLLNRALLIPLF